MYGNFKYKNDRFVPFAAPFLLGGLTGAVLTPYFRPPVYYPPYPYYPPRPYPPFRPF